MSTLIVACFMLAMFLFLWSKDRHEIKRFNREIEIFEEELSHAQTQVAKLQSAKKTSDMLIARFEKDVTTLKAERDQAREVAERFREKYLHLKEKEETRLLRARQYMAEMKESRVYKYQEEDQ